MTGHKKGSLFVISAPSGTGKTTICERLLKALPNLKMSISHTTRTPRQDEKHGVHYFFVTKEQFEKMIKNDEFVEWAEVYGNLYGTSKKMINDLINAGVDILLDIDTQGAKNIKRLYPDSVLIFILPPSLESLEERLKNRHENSETIKERLSKAANEIAHYEFYDYIVVNDNLEKAVNEILCIINAERLKVSRINKSMIEKILQK